MQWDRIYGGSSDEQAEAVIETSDHGFALAGYTYTYVGGAYDDFWLVKTDSNGVATASGFDRMNFLATVVAPIVMGTPFAILIILKLNERRRKARKKLDEKAAEQLRI